MRTRIAPARALICGLLLLVLSAGCTPYRTPPRTSPPPSEPPWRSHHLLPNLSLAGAREIDSRSLAETEHILQLRDGTVLFQADLDIDVDGSPNARRLDPDHGQLTTSYRYSGLTGQRSYVDSEQVPYIVLPLGFPERFGIELGDLAVVIHRDRVAFAVFADVGPADRIGEGSIRLAELLGHHPWDHWDGNESFSTHGSIVTTDVLYIVFPRSRSAALTPATAVETIQRNGAVLFRSLGGVLPIESLP
ncbi:MAG: glycoside hydrolase family 75 protein [bacterium]